MRSLARRSVTFQGLRQRSGVRNGGLIAVAAIVVFGSSAPSALAACNKTITITEGQQINYGTIAVTAGGGTVTISPSGGVTAPGGFVVTGAPTAGSFNVTGTNGCMVGISTSVSSTLSNAGGATMTITNFKTNPAVNGQLTPAGGQLTFTVGADLVVGAGQAGGNYSGAYLVTVVYN